jgi:hypothetical protein
MVSVRGIKAEFIGLFAIGILFMLLGIYGIYYLFAVEVPSGRFSSLPFAAVGCVILGLIAIRQTYPIFIPERNRLARSRVCPFCGALVDTDDEVCEKCGRPLENQP